MLQSITNSWIQEWLSAKCDEFESDLETVRYQDCGQMPFSEFAVWHPIDGSPSSAPLLRFRSPPRVQALWIDEELIGYLFEAESTSDAFDEVADVGTDTDRFFLVQPSQFESVHNWFRNDPKFEELGGNELVQLVENQEGLRMIVITSGDGNGHIYAAPINQDTLTVALIET